MHRQRPSLRLSRVLTCLRRAAGAPSGPEPDDARRVLRRVADAGRHLGAGAALLLATVFALSYGSAALADGETALQTRSPAMQRVGASTDVATPAGAASDASGTTDDELPAGDAASSASDGLQASGASASDGLGASMISASPADAEATASGAEVIPWTEGSPPAGAPVLEGTYIPVAADADDFAIGPDGRRAYITRRDSNSLDVVDIESRSLLKTIAGEPHPQDDCHSNLGCGRGASGVALSPDERLAYVTSMKEDAVAVVDLEQGATVAAIPTGRFPRPIVLTADGKRGFVFNTAGDSVSMLDLVRRKALGRPYALNKDGSDGGAFGRLLSLQLSPDARLFYTVSDTRSSVVAIQAATRKKQAEFVFDDYDGRRIIQLAPDGKTLWVQDEQGLTKLDALSLKRLDSYPFCARIQSEDFALSPDGKTAAIAESDTNRIRLVDLASRKTLGMLPTATWPRGLRFLPGSKTLAMLTGISKRHLLLWDSSFPMPADALVAETGETLCPPPLE